MSSEGLVGIRDLVPAGSHVSIASHGTDKGLIAEFYNEAVEQVFESEKQGRKIFKDVPHVHIFAPGNKSDIRRPVKLEDDERSPSDPNRFPRQWNAFLNSQEQAQDGMPLEQWAQLSKAEVLEWKACKFHTVEQIAAMPDTAAHNAPMNFRTVRDKAKAWLATASGDQAVVSRLEAENNVLKADLEMMKNQIAELAAQQTKRGPGRPRKEEGEHNDD